jgi:hypothetical protein
MSLGMTTLSPSDASILALIAENISSRGRAQSLLRKPKGAKARRIANLMVSAGRKTAGSKIEREAATSIRRWAAVNKNTNAKKAASR